MTDRELVARYIEESPDQVGANGARLRDYGVSVWALVAYFQAASEDVDRVASDYDLPREAMEAALAYYRQHKAAVHARIAEHDAVFT